MTGSRTHRSTPQPRGEGADVPHGALAGLPRVDVVLALPEASAPTTTYGRERLTAAVRAALDVVRSRVRAGGQLPDAHRVLRAAVERLDAIHRRDVRRVINGTGVVLHTNLGRAPLSDAARRAVDAAAGYATVEYELDEGRRGSRTAHVGELAAELCGSEAGLVVNNGAAALVLCLAALAVSGEVVVSRGELIEIGGSFRLPDVMAASGARMVEVGTTNRTRGGDYAGAVGVGTRVLLKVHRSNFRLVGFAEETTVAELAELARANEVPLVYDLGSGLVRDVPAGPLADEPSVQRALRDGADLVVFSGDKLLGGPQAGVIVGREDLVRRCVQHPLARALRIDKLQRAALEATLHAHLRTRDPDDLPTVAMLTVSPDQLRDRADRLVARLRSTLDGSVDVAVVELASAIGGGSLPGVELPSFGLAVAGGNPDELARKLRRGELPVIARIADGRVLLDLRTVAPAEDDELARQVLAALG
jgi:L-seryl-tRNA(Ser) seleniumtransferase